MDKINRALSASEDNAVMINELRVALKRVASSAFEVRTGNNGSLGEVSAPKGGAIVLAFDGGGEASVEFCGKSIGSGTSPVIVPLPAGRGEIKAKSRSGVRALVLYKN